MTYTIFDDGKPQKAYDYCRTCKRLLNGPHEYVEHLEQLHHDVSDLLTFDELIAEILK